MSVAGAYARVVRFDLRSLVDAELWALVEESQAFYARRPARRGPGSLDELRQMRAAASASVAAACDPPPSVEQVTAGGRSVTIRVHLPRHGSAGGVLLELHGGGFYMGSAAASDLRHRRLADALSLAVVGVEYRLAPEHPWPAAPDDCETAALWLAANSEDRFGTSRRAIGGFSAGATLAMATLLRLRDQDIHAFVAGVLQFGTYDLSARTPAGRLIADEYFLDAYAGDAADRTHPDLSPIFAELADLPPMLIVVGSNDILLEDNLAMAARLAAAGVAVELAVYPESPHGFTAHPTSMAEAAQKSMESWLQQRVSYAAGRRLPWILR